MSNMIQRALAATAGFALLCIAGPASAQEIVRIRGTIERIDGPAYVIKSRDGSELKLTLTDNPRPPSSSWLKIRDAPGVVQIEEPSIR